MLVAVEAPRGGASCLVVGVEGQAVQPGGPAPKRLRDESRGLGGGGKQQHVERREERGDQGRGKWGMPGFSVDYGSAMMVAGSYVVGAV